MDSDEKLPKAELPTIACIKSPKDMLTKLVTVSAREKRPEKSHKLPGSKSAILGLLVEHPEPGLDGFLVIDGLLGEVLQICTGRAGLGMSTAHGLLVY